jgi:hypothetical protein
MLNFNLAYAQENGKDGIFIKQDKGLFALIEEMQDGFEKLHPDHTGIEQWEIQGAFDWLNAHCQKLTKDKGEQVTVFTEISCTAMASGSISGTLENWGYTFVDPAPIGQAPQLIS